MYQNGWSMTQSDEEASIWYRKAAEQGRTKAQSRLQDNNVLKNIIQLRITKYEECNLTTKEQEIRDEHSNSCPLLVEGDELQTDTEDKYSNVAVQRSAVPHGSSKKKSKCCSILRNRLQVKRYTVLTTV